MTQFDNDLSLGQYLRREREKRGFTLEQVASVTKIGVRQLHALESDQYSDLPAKPFIRGFVTSYARFVGLDPKEVLTHYSRFIDEMSHERPNREGGHSGYAFERREGGDQSRMILGIIMGSFIVLGGIGMVILKPALHHHHHSHLDKLRALQSHSPSPDPSPSAALAAAASPHAGSPSPSASKGEKVKAEGSKPVPSPSASKTEASPTPSASPSPTVTDSDPLNSGLGLKPGEMTQRMVIKAKNDVWVRYQVDGKPVMQFPLRQGKVLVLRAKDQMLFQVGNPKDVEISHNGTGYLPGSSFGFVQRQGDPTLIFPPQLAEKIQEPFPGQSILSGRPVPATGQE